MEIIRKVEEMQTLADSFRRDSLRIGFVPTMGALHKGHLSLIRRAREISDVVIVSMFVNPTQFGPNEDYNLYPRDFERDESLAAAEGVKAIFYPSKDEIYPEDYATYTEVEGMSGVLEGATRPAHFRGVTTVVNKLFNIVKPHIAVFGQKDAQQALIIKRMTSDLGFDIEIMVVPIVREEDGLALSSRNEYLSDEERQQATALHEGLLAAEELKAAGTTDAATIEDRVREIISSAPLAVIDYVAVVHPETLEPMEDVGDGALVAVAVRFGATRLIDNTVL